MRTSLTTTVVLGLMAWAPAALAAPGDLLITEYANGSVLEFGQGGDLLDAERFATGLSAPVGICVGPGGHIYVAESVATGGSEITIITNGGDFTDAEPFATGPAGITALWCDEEMILVGMVGAPPPDDPPPDEPPTPTGAVFDAAAGGMFLLTGDAVAVELVLPGAMARSEEGSLFSANGDVWDISEGGPFGEIPPFTTGRMLFVIEERDGRLLGGDYNVPEVVDFTDGGDLSVAPVYATLPVLGTGVQGLLDAGDAGLFALVADQIFEIGDGGDMGAAEPRATGLLTGQVGYHGMLHHVCSTDADCFDQDACNGAERCENNTCLPPEGPPDCEDEDVCTADSCDAQLGCVHDPIAGCCSGDDQCALDELCDGATDTCVPVTTPTSGASDESAGDSEGGPTGGADTTGAQPTDGAGLDEDPQGCGCRSSMPSAAPWWLLLLPWLGRRRRIRARRRAR